MTFNFLARGESQALIDAAVQSKLVQADRFDRLEGIDSQFVAVIRDSSTALDRFIYELRACNEKERLLDGTVPMPIFLTNCANWLRFRDRPETALFAQLANRIDNATNGRPMLQIAADLTAAVRQEAIIGRNQMLDYGFLAAGALAGRSVGRILVPRFDGGEQKHLSTGEPWVMSGTAWMIAEGLAITNHHVINARGQGEPAASESDFVRQANDAVVQFDFDAAGMAPTSIEVGDVLASDPRLDFALVSLKAGAGPPPLKLRSSPLRVHASSWQAVNIIQHPLGGYKKIGIRSNIATKADDDSVRYFTDTDTGSSGSPVCDDSWQVVAIHRGAEHVTGVSFQGQDTAYVNLGSQIQAVLSEIGRQDGSLIEKIAQSQAVLS